jgi:uncharacterized protein YaaR (DUF327 family)
MKVQDVRSRQPLTPLMTVRESGADVSGQRSFHRQMNQFASEEYERYLGQLKEEIEHQGRKLVARMDINELDQYRRLIAQLLNETASNAYRYIRLERFGSRGEHRIYGLIKKVNEKLEEMTRQLLSEQRDQLALLRMADDIRGLLVDLLL